MTHTQIYTVSKLTTGMKTLMPQSLVASDRLTAVKLSDFSFSKAYSVFYLNRNQFLLQLMLSSPNILPNFIIYLSSSVVILSH